MIPHIKQTLPALVLAALLAGGSFPTSMAQAETTGSSQNPMARIVCTQKCKENPRNALTVQPLGLALGIGNLEYEHMLGPDTAGAVRLNFFTRSLGDWNANAIGIGGSYRWFVPLGTETPPRGLWYGPAIDLLNINAKFGGDSGSSNFVQLAGEIGYKWIFRQTSNLVVSPLAQLGYNLGSLSIGGNNLAYGGRFVFNVGLTVGLAF